MTVDKIDPGSLPAPGVGAQKHLEKEVAIARPKIGQGSGGADRKVFGKPSGPKGNLSQEGVKALEIPAAGLRGRIGGREAIEKFG